MSLHRWFPVLLLPTMLLLGAGCGGSGDGERASGAASKPDEGAYFGEAQSDALNPAIAALGKAKADYRSSAAKCERTAAKLFEAGTTPAQAVVCHLDRTTRIVEAIDEVASAFETVAKEPWRAPCEQSISSMDEFLDDYAAAWNAVLADWKRYAADGTLDEKTLNRNVASASEMDQEFDTERVDELTEACYSAESISAETRSDDDDV